MQELPMEQVLADILKLESEAKDIVKKQTDRRDALDSVINEKLDKMCAEYNAKADHRIEEIRASELERLESQLAEVRADHNKQMKRLSDISECESENFADRIFSAVLGKKI